MYYYYEGLGTRLSLYLALALNKKKIDSVDNIHCCIILLLFSYSGMDLLSTPEVHITMEMGGFSPVGVEEAPPICEAEQLNGLPIGRMGPRILYVVRDRRVWRGEQRAEGE